MMRNSILIFKDTREKVHIFLETISYQEFTLKFIKILENFISSNNEFAFKTYKI